MGTKSAMWGFSSTPCMYQQKKESESERFGKLEMLKATRTETERDHQFYEEARACKASMHLTQ